MEPAITLAQLKLIMPKLSKTAESYLPYLNDAMAEGRIDGNKMRQASFLAQVAHESCEFRFMNEIWGPTPEQLRYEGNVRLGNIHPGDGKKYMGRGPIQLTGLKNYRACGLALELDLVNHPELASQVDVCFRTAAWFWVSNGLNQLADNDDFHAITVKINGGTNGWLQRLAYYQHATEVLGPEDFSDVQS